MADRQPARGKRGQARLFRVLNVPMRFVLGLPLPTPPSGRLMLLTLTGRRTGRTYRQPVSYVRMDANTLITPGGGRWKRNLVEGQPVTIRLRGRDVVAYPEVTKTVPETEELLTLMMAENPAVSRYTGIPRGADGHPDQARVARAFDYGFRIVRWRLAPGEG